MLQTIKPLETSVYTAMNGDIYDLLYSHRNYAAEASKLSNLITLHCQSGGNKILDAACGTGSNIKYLEELGFSLDGLDISAEQVAAARKKLPHTTIVQADMLDFAMDRQYDVILCLFNSIAYLKTQANLNQAISNMAHHLKPGGLIIIEPWLKPEDFIVRNATFDTAHTKGDLAAARMAITSVNDNVTTLRLHHMVRTGQTVEHFVETHELATYTDEDYSDACGIAGLKTEIDASGLRGRRLWLGKKSL